MGDRPVAIVEQAAGGRRAGHRADAGFLTQLIAARLQVPQQRKARRVPAADAAGLYRTVQTLGRGRRTGSRAEL